MTSARNYASHEGTSEDAKSIESPCPHCKMHTLTVREWESHDGGSEDYEYECLSCGKTWWVDGPDA